MDGSLLAAASFLIWMGDPIRREGRKREEDEEELTTTAPR